jgi:hypothetical protein
VLQSLQRPRRAVVASSHPLRTCCLRVITDSAVVVILEASTKPFSTVFGLRSLHLFKGSCPLGTRAPWSDRQRVPTLCLPFPLPTKFPSDEPQDTEDDPKIYEGQSYF